MKRLIVEKDNSKKQRVFNKRRIVLTVSIFIVVFILIFSLITYNIFINRKYDDLYLNIKTYTSEQEDYILTSNYLDETKEAYLGYLSYVTPANYDLSKTEIPGIPINFDTNKIDDKIRIKLESSNGYLYIIDEFGFKNVGHSITIDMGDTVFFEHVINDELTSSDEIVVTVVLRKRELLKETIVMDTLNEVINLKLKPKNDE